MSGEELSQRLVCEKNVSPRCRLRVMLSDVAVQSNTAETVVYIILDVFAVFDTLKFFLSIGTNIHPLICVESSSSQ